MKSIFFVTVVLRSQKDSNIYLFLFFYNLIFKIKSKFIKTNKIMIKQLVQ